MKTKVKLKRVYDLPETDDGERILVDRLWPRGLTKAKARVDLWMKEIAPSNELRKWFGHDPEKWSRFRGRYRTELKHNDELVNELKRRARKGPITLLFAARDVAHNEAVVIKQYIGSQ
jgi:uncharacterized protein YeaO (DUF488 family)